MGENVQPRLRELKALEKRISVIWYGGNAFKFVPGAVLLVPTYRVVTSSRLLPQVSEDCSEAVT